jgi:hypothetical protein
MTTNSLIIDLPTGAAKRVARVLGKLKSTIAVGPAAPYLEDPTFSQLPVETLWTVEKLEGWCYATKGIDYVGVVAAK